MVLWIVSLSERCATSLHAPIELRAQRAQRHAQGEANVMSKLGRCRLVDRAAAQQVGQVQTAVPLGTDNLHIG